MNIDGHSITVLRYRYSKIATKNCQCLQTSESLTTTAIEPVVPPRWCLTGKKALPLSIPAGLRVCSTKLDHASNKVRAAARMFYQSDLPCATEGGEKAMRVICLVLAMQCPVKDYQTAGSKQRLVDEWFDMLVHHIRAKHDVKRLCITGMGEDAEEENKQTICATTTAPGSRSSMAVVTRSWAEGSAHNRDMIRSFFPKGQSRLYHTYLALHSRFGRGWFRVETRQCIDMWFQRIRGNTVSFPLTLFSGRDHSCPKCSSLAALYACKRRTHTYHQEP